jgi:putative peptide zinc metalloprotease protein
MSVRIAPATQTPRASQQAVQSSAAVNSRPAPRWPALRDELDIQPGPSHADGEPTWVLHDPARQLFFRIDWLSFEILSRWGYGDTGSILAAIACDTPLEAGEDDVKRVLAFLTEQQLLRPEGEEALARLVERRQASRSSWWTWLIHHYLFFRIPLWRPDAWLRRWLPVANVFFSRRFVGLSLAAAALGLALVARQWETLRTYLFDSFSLEGMVFYALALSAVKWLHELGHAFALKRQGGRVPAMGVAFLVMTPMAYTDVNEAWRITGRRQRLQVSGAGIATEGIIAAWALLAWALVPDSGLRSALFFLATTSWVMTLALNANPFMRFDGYFILCDWLDFPNLHARSFALARWKMRQWLFGLADEPPERFAAGKRWALIAFAWSVWIYRLVLFLGIALLVYHLFTKLLGVLLFLVEIYWFIWYPVRRELAVWWERRADIGDQRRARISALVVLTLITVAALPLPSWVWVSAQLKPAEVWAVHAPVGAYVEALTVADGQAVARGAVLMRLSAPEIRMQADLQQARWARVHWEAVSSSIPQAESRPLATARAQGEAALAEYNRSRQALAQLQPRAPFDGRLFLLDPDLAKGQWVGARERLGYLVGPGPWRVETWVEEDQVRRISVGARAHFYAPSLGRTLSARVDMVDTDRAQTLPDAMLAAPSGGHVLVRESKGEWIPERSVYRVTLALEEPLPEAWAQVARGDLVLAAGARSALWSLLESAVSVIWREMSP